MSEKGKEKMTIYEAARESFELAIALCAVMLWSSEGLHRYPNAIGWVFWMCIPAIVWVICFYAVYGWYRRHPK
jgi:hypothetical protein